MGIKVLLVDDYNIFRQGLKLLLEGSYNLEVIGQAENSDEIFEILSKNEPDVILLDLLFLQQNIVSLCKKIKEFSSSIPFIIISVKEIENTLIECIIQGARGFLWKDSSVKELVEAINKVASGGKYFAIPESQIFEKVIDKINHQSSKEDYHKTLTTREIEIVRHFALGEKYKQIAEELKISPRTVESHKNNILRKLNLNSLADLVKYALKNQIINL